MVQCNLLRGGKKEKNYTIQSIDKQKKKNKSENKFHSRQCVLCNVFCMWLGIKG